MHSSALRTRSSLARSTSRGLMGVVFRSIMPWPKCRMRFNAELRPAIRCVSYLLFVSDMICGMTLVTFSSLSVLTREFYARVNERTSMLTLRSFCILRALMAELTCPLFHQLMITLTLSVRREITPIRVVWCYPTSLKISPRRFLSTSEAY